MFRIMAGFLGLLLAASCGSPRQEIVEAKLHLVGSCVELEQTLRQAALDQMNERLDQALESALNGSDHCYYWGMEDADGARNYAPAAPSAAGTSSQKSGGGASQVSGTNNQVAGVDEADFIKNDNKYIYLVSGGALRIVEAWPAEQTKEIAKVAIEGEPKKLYVEGDFALVYSSLKRADAPQNEGRTYDRGSSECTYGYNCSFTGDGNPTRLALYDISNRAAPALVREIRLSGSYVNARRIGAAVHTVLSYPGVSFPEMRYYPEGIDTCGSIFAVREIVLAFETLRAKNTKIIQAATLADWIPAVTDTIYVGGQPQTSQNLLASCNGFYRASLTDGSAFTTILSLDMTDTKPVTAATIVSRPGAVYGSPEALYLAVPHERQGNGQWYAAANGLDEATTVHKFHLSQAPVASRYVGSGVVKGRVLNQFAMDEWQDHLRVATTTGHLPSDTVHSTLTVLRESRGLLAQVGQLDGLAPKEDIRSVRFDGERGYIVTFKKTDPLFVLDLEHAENPRVLAELKIPGFSTYMHPMDRGHLLTIGYDADDQGSFAWFTGVQLQIFDVSLPNQPRLMHKEVIGTRGSSSEALTNHLAFTFFPPKEVLALPMTVCEGGSGGGSYGTNMTFSGLMVYNVTLASGFKLRGKVPHATAGDNWCHNWWTDATSKVKRSIIMDDYVFSISDQLLKVNHLDHLDTDLVSLPIDK